MKLFLAVLIPAAVQDFRFRSISGRLLAISGAVGFILCFRQGREIGPVLGSMAVGAFLLLLSRISRGAIGEGDGWFFTVSGLYLNFWDNLLLLSSGLFLGGIFALFLTTAAFLNGSKGSAGKRRIPFLPLLLPAGLWMALCKNG